MNHSAFAATVKQLTRTIQLIVRLEIKNLILLPRMSKVLENSYIVVIKYFKALLQTLKIIPNKNKNTARQKLKKWLSSKKI